MNVAKWIQKNTETLSGKTIAITGSTGGLGRPLCRYMASLGANLILIDRNRARSEQWGKELLQEYPTLAIDYITADLSDIQSVATATDQLLQLPLDIFIHNAGAYSIPRPLCATGFDPLFQINFISPYYMIRRLLPNLKKRGGRAVAVGSIAHRYSKTDPQNIDFADRGDALAYGNAKRYLMVAMEALGKENSAPPLITAHPGISFTGITDHYPKWLFALIKHPMKIIFMPPKIACLSILSALFQPSAENHWIGPRLFDIWGSPKQKRLPPFSPKEEAHIINTAEKIYNSLT